MTEPNHIAEARKKVSRPQIREVFLRNGFTIKPDRDDLRDYVYEAAFELLELAAPAVQGEPECGCCGRSDGCDDDCDAVVIGGHRATEQQPDVAQLVEALELALEYWRDRQQRYKNRRPKWVIEAESALAAHRKQSPAMTTNKPEAIQ